MRRSLFVGGVLTALIGLLLAGCGGGKAIGPTVSITLSPSGVSLTRGAVFQITATAEDAGHNPVTTPGLAYHCVQLPSQTACTPGSPISVSSSGLVCAGQWDANATRCYDCSNPDLATDQCPASGATPLPLGSASITATATVNEQTVTSSAVVVTDHWPIDSVEVCSVDSTGARTCPASAAACVSQNLTAQFAAEAFSNDPTACQSITGSSATPCQIPDGTAPGSVNTVGSINWSVSPGQVATADAVLHVPSSPVVLTAATPGQGVVTASIGAAGAAVSGSSPFTTCAVKSIHVHQLNAPAAGDTQTSFTAPVSATVPLVADVTDTSGALLTTTTWLSWFTSQPSLASVALGTVNTASPGTAEITAACLPSACNINMNQPIFADGVVTAHITGTIDSTVLVTTAAPPSSTTVSNNIASIDSISNAAGTTFVLPANLQVNSMAITPVGDPLFLGTVCTAGTTTGPNDTACSGLLRFDPTVSTVSSPVTTLTGSVIGTDGVHVVLADPTNNQTVIATTGGPSLEKLLPIPNAQAAAFAIDGSKIYIVAGNTLYVYSPGLPLKRLSLGAPAASGAAQSVAFFATGAMAYVADGIGDEEVNTCTDVIQGSNSVLGGSPSNVAAIPNATGMVATDTPYIDEFDVTSNGACPPVITPTPPVPIRNAFPGVANFNVRQLLVSDDSNLVVILSDQGVLIYNIATKQTSTVALAGSALPLSGGLTPDSSTLYVGANDGVVHRVTLTTNPPADAQTIAVSICIAGTPNCTPDFVVVRPVATVATLSSLTLTPLNPTIGVNGTPQNCPSGTPAGEVCFTVQGKFSDGTTRDMTNFVSWASSNQQVAIIGPITTVVPPLTPGQARALAIGTATITASSSGVSASTTMTVQ